MRTVIRQVISKAAKVGVARLLIGVVAIFLFSPAGSGVQGFMARTGALGPVLAIVLDVVVLAIACWAFSSASVAALVGCASILPLLLWLGTPESGPGAQLVATYKFALVALVGWLGFMAPGTRRLRWAAALVPSVLACTMTLLLFVPM